jgi:HlyD family secretion protein
MQVDASVDEADVGALKVGQPVEFTVDAYPGRVFRGEVIQLRKAPQVVQNVVTYDAVISAANPDQALLPGLTATVRIVTARRDKALLVSNAALRWRPPGSAPTAAAPGEGTVFIPGPQGEAQPVPLRTGIADPTVTEVLEGTVKPGQPLIIGDRTEEAPKRPAMPPMGGPRF